MSKIKIAYLIDTISSQKAGTEKQLMGIIKRIDRASFEPYLICLWRSPWMEQNKLPCKVFVLDYTGFIKLNFIGVIKRLLDLLKQEQFHIIQTFFEDSIFVGYLGKMLSREKPLLLSSRRDTGLGSDEPWYRSFYRVVLPVVNRGFDGIVANGDNVREYVARRERTSPDKIKVIHNGIALPDHIEQKPPIFRDTQAELWIGIVANLKPVKRIDVFLRAMARLRMISDKMDFKAVVVGEGPEAERLQKMAGELDLLSTVYFAGAVNNVIAYLQNLDIGVLCSDREGFSNSILEYMACGLPVVVTSVGGNPELVDNTNGFCVPSGDPEALAEAIGKLALHPDLRQKMGDRSLKKVRQNYTWDKITKQWEHYYWSLLEDEGTKS